MISKASPARKAVLITGGAKRVGAALTRHFSAKGYDVALHYNASEKDAKKLQTDIEDEGGWCELFAHDLADSKGLPALMKRVKKAMPHCELLINNASIFERASLMETSEALFDRQFAVNFKAPFFATQAFAKTFGKGCVINILDADISKAGGTHFAYMLSKKALAEFTLMAARELGPEIRVNGICPGILLPSNELDERYMKKLAATLPLRAIGSLEQVTETAQFLYENSAMTGQLIFTDGGQQLL